MKKFAIVFLVMLFIFSLFPSYKAFSEQTVQDPGVYLKKIGIVKGFPDGSLNENAYITQAEYLALLARALQSIKTVKRDNLVKQTNFFDKLINKAYHAYLILKYKIKEAYYGTYMRFARGKNSVDRKEWYFENVLYLKINGFGIPEDFHPDAVISEGYAVKWAMDTLGLGEGSEYIVSPGDVKQNAVPFVLSVEHDMALDGISTARPLKRRDAFNLMLKIINK